MSKFLVLLNDKDFGDSPEEKYTTPQVTRHLINNTDLEVVDVVELPDNFRYTDLKEFLGDF